MMGKTEVERAAAIREAALNLNRHIQCAVEDGLRVEVDVQTDYVIGTPPVPSVSTSVFRPL